MIVGMAGAEFGIRGFIDAYDAQTGKRAWRFYSPGTGRASRAATRKRPRRRGVLRGGGSIWVTGYPDPQSNSHLLGFAGNPGPDYYSDAREGDNLYTASLVALQFGQRPAYWHYQFTRDVHDWDATEVPVLADLVINGQTRKVTSVRQPAKGCASTHRSRDGKTHRGEAVRGDDVGEGSAPAAGPSCCPAISRTKTAKTCPPISGAGPTSIPRHTIRRQSSSS